MGREAIGTALASLPPAALGQPRTLGQLRMIACAGCDAPVADSVLVRTGYDAFAGRPWGFGFDLFRPAVDPCR